MKSHELNELVNSAAFAAKNSDPQKSEEMLQLLAKDISKVGKEVIDFLMKYVRGWIEKHGVDALGAATLLSMASQEVIDSLLKRLYEEKDGVVALRIAAIIFRSSEKVDQQQASEYIWNAYLYSVREENREVFSLAQNYLEQIVEKEKGEAAKLTTGEEDKIKSHLVQDELLTMARVLERLAEKNKFYQSQHPSLLAKINNVLEFLDPQKNSERRESINRLEKFVMDDKWKTAHRKKAVDSLLETFGEDGQAAVGRLSKIDNLHFELKEYIKASLEQCRLPGKDKDFPIVKTNTVNKTSEAKKFIKIY